MTSGPARVERVAAGRGDDPAATVAPSAAALAAQAALEARRAALGIVPRLPADLDQGQGAAASSGSASTGLDTWDRWALQEARRQRSAKEIERAAKDAAWQRWAAGMTAAREKREAAAPVAPVAPRPVTAAAPVDFEALRLANLKESDPRAYYLETLPELPDHVRAYPSLLAAARRGGHVPQMRLYLLCKALDPAGRGIVGLDQVRRYFVGQDAPYRAFNARRLRQVIAAGAGVFWERHTDDRLWLKSPGRVAAALGVDRLEGLPVAVPVWAIWGSHHEAAAAFYAAWHAGRGDDPNPIGRAALVKLTGAAASTQRTYDHTAEVQRQKNIVILGDATKEGMQEAAWHFGNVFRFRDHVGRLGRRGWVYVAASIPSTYHTGLNTLARGRQRKANKLIRLVTNGARGKDDQVRTLYYVDGAAAGDAFNRDPKQAYFYRHGPALKVTAACPPKLAGAYLWGVIHP